MAWNIGGTENIAVETEVIGAREFQAEMNANAASVERMGAATATAGTEMDVATKRSWLMSQAMFTLRRVAYAGTLALAAIGTGAVYMGLKFDSTMEQNTVTMSHFLGGVTQAKTELQTLFQLAATTPFDFAGVSTAAKQFLAFGFSVADTNKDLRVIADTASAFGGSTDVINRIVLALGQMQAKGKVMGQELLQLQEVGVPALQILQEQLHLTDQQVANIGRTGIKASVAIPALIKGLQDRYGGLSAQQAKTFAGQLSTLKDYAAQTLGVIMMPLFQTMKQDVLPTAILIATAIQKGFGKDGLVGSLREVQASNAPEWFKILYNDIYELVQFINGPFRAGMTPIVQDVLLFAGAVLYAIGPILHLINTLDHFHHIVGMLITAWGAYKLAQGLVWLGNLSLIKSFGRLALSGILYAAGALKTLIARLMYGAVLEGEVMLETEALTVAYAEQTVATEALTVAQTELDVAMDANPIGLIILAVAALIILILALATNFHGFRDWIVGHWWALAPILLGPFGLVLGPAGYIVTHIEQIKGYITSFIDWVSKKWDALSNKITSLPGFSYLSAGFDIAKQGAGYIGLAGGGTVTQGGLSWVGERGPELMWLPPSAQVAPLDHVGSILGGDGGAFTSHTTLVLDRKVVGEASSKYTLDREARK
jgi:tape measure domain-containing protein